jgi:hypothetical protein
VSEGTTTANKAESERMTLHRNFLFNPFRVESCSIPNPRLPPGAINIKPHSRLMTFPTFQPNYASTAPATASFVGQSLSNLSTFKPFQPFNHSTLHPYPPLLGIHVVDAIRQNICPSKRHIPAGDQCKSCGSARELEGVAA